MRNLHVSIVACVALACAAHASPKEVLVGGPCDGCEEVFEGRPAKLASSTRIAAAKEPGEPLAIDGIVRDAAKKPVAGVIVYAYHTDAAGIYPKAKSRHGAIRAFAITDKNGAYHFDTIRPASYPKSKIPQHVHMHVVEPGRCHYYIDEMLFTDDPFLTAEQRKAQDHGRGGSAIVTPTGDKKQWKVRRDITLGAGIGDYDRCK
jgi:protocatechuate 3,4-dioxygenase beta subunit